jgi:hypothetical protein
VATSSLELGIDMGAVDLVLQVESPKSVARGLQRIGRAGHGVGETSKGRIFPKFRADLLEATVVARRMREGAIESTVVPRNPLDVLAQQIVAMAAVEDLNVDDVYALVTRTHSFAELPRTLLENVLDMLDGRYPSSEFAELRPRIVWDRVNGTIRARQGARSLAITNAGTIPDRGLFLVTLPDGRRVQYIVSGGGGAFMHATHQIPKIDLEGTSEDEFRCYPLRGDSLARYSRLYDNKLARGSGALRLTPDQAASYMAELLHLDPTRGERVKLGLRARTAARLIQPAPAQRGFHRLVSELFDWNDPPMFKSFLRLDASGRQLRVRCFGVSGCAGTEDAPPVEDELTITW